MQTCERVQTAELIRTAGETCKRIHDVTDELDRIGEQYKETVAYLTWWRFLDYDVRTIPFLNKLDMRH